ncbi:MAG TPA: fused MFS/spermidine synthase [Vicinamibacterales bacterium]|nr:fused MFS/spermidine synthase [Vicinamibacterales bacterium]
MFSRAAVFALFYLSGIAGLIYQVLWLRRLSLVFGVTVYAASTVLAAFMAGLALGSALSGRVLRRGMSPLKAFAIAEILIGVTGLLSPFLLDAAWGLYGALHNLAPESLSVLTVARLVCSFAILALPTTMMGITLPLLTAAVSDRKGGAATNVSLLYALNTLGAMTGTLLAGYLLIPDLGITNSFLLAASINVLVGVLAFLLDRSPNPPINHPLPDHQSANSLQSPIANLKLIGVVVAISGFASLGLEIVWFRLMLQFVAATTEAFTAMLTTVLGGIAAGGFIAATILRSKRDPSAALGIVQALTGVAAVASMSFLLWTVANGWDTMQLWRAVLIAILPPSLCMGAGFPLALGIAARSAEPGSLARRIGALYSLNVAGAILGSLGTGFVLLTRAGSLNTLIVLGALLAVSGAMILVKRGGAASWASAIALLTVFFVTARDLPDPFRVAIDRRYGNQLLEFWRDEGAQTAVSVRASQFQHVLYLDGLHQANDQPAMVELHRSIGHLPMVLHGAPRTVLVVGMGGGATPGAVSQYDANVQIVELSDSVRKAAPFFAHVNYDLLNRPNVSVRVDDGRNFLALSGRKFDVITADIIQPGHAGAGHVYSREYFTLVRNALNDNGVVLQWIGQRPFVEYSLIMRTFLDVFPNATLWADAGFMVGTVQPLKIDPAAIDRLRQRPETRAALDAVGLRSFDDLRAWFTAGPDEMRAFVGAGPILTDDRPLVEYHHRLPRPEEQPPLNLSSLKGDVSRFIAGGPSH